MKLLAPDSRRRAMSLLELLVVIAVLAVLAAFILNNIIVDQHVRNRAMQVQCMSNLRVFGISFRAWADDHNGLFPMSVTQTNGGSSEFITGTNAFRHFQVMSNELSTPKVLLCPADWMQKGAPDARSLATNFTNFGNTNISFFVGIDANETNAGSLLSGDRNITNGIGLKNGVMEMTANSTVGWGPGIHHGMGNILLADGSARRVLSPAALRAVVANTGLTTNRLQMPILTP